MRKYIYIGLGGFLGAALRVTVKDISLYKINEVFPINTLLINVLGCFLIALFLTVCIEILEVDPDIRLGVATGFVGAFTTFSTVCKEVVSLLSHGFYFTAAAYIIASLLLGFAAVYLGVVTAREIILKFTRNKPDNAE